VWPAARSRARQQVEALAAASSPTSGDRRQARVHCTQRKWCFNWWL